jgi:hypothetical protein
LHRHAVLLSIAIHVSVKRQCRRRSSRRSRQAERATRLMATRARAASTQLSPPLEERDASRVTLEDRAHLKGAPQGGRVVGLPDLRGANVALRLSGSHPIGEKDRAARHLYLGAAGDAGLPPARGLSRAAPESWRLPASCATGATKVVAPCDPGAALWY